MDVYTGILECVLRVLKKLFVASTCRTKGKGIKLSPSEREFVMQIKIGSDFLITESRLTNRQ